MNQIIENLNFVADSRNRPGERLTVEIDGIEHALPAKWQLCSVCEGKGTHVHPAIDAGGLSAEDFDNDPDFAESYFGGDYDVTCQRCQGRTTERVVDWDRVPKPLREAWEKQEEADAAYERERRAEIAMGC